MYNRLTTVFELLVILTSIMLYFVSFHAVVHGKVIKIINRTKEKPYYTYIVRYNFLKRFNIEKKYRTIKRKPKIYVNTGVFIYLNYYGSVKNINFRPIIQEERNNQEHIVFLRLLFIISIASYLYCVYLGHDFIPFVSN